MPKAEVKETIEETSVIIELPVGEVPLTTWGVHINTNLTPRQSRMLRRIAAGLDRAQARLANGARVVNPTDALKFLLESSDSDSD